MTDLLGLDFTEADLAPPSGNAARFGGRWRLVAAGLSNVWRYGDLELPAASGRLLMRGPNGTGKTTALEALWPYVLDLNSAKLGAGKARFTSLKLLMSEGASSKRRYGYVWLTFAAPDSFTPTTGRRAADGVDPQDEDGPVLVTYGVRLQYSEGASPPVKPIGFTFPGRPLHTVPLHAEHGSALELEQFTELVTAAGGQVFTDDDDAYVDDLARTVWGTTASELRTLAGRLRAVRNPSLLGDVSPTGAAEALRASLPSVDPTVLSATAEALDASNTTREAFARDSEAAQTLDAFAQTWAAHATDVVHQAHSAAVEAATNSGQLELRRRKLAQLLDKRTQAEKDAAGHLAWLDEQLRRVQTDLTALEKSDAYKDSGRLAELERTGRAERDKATTDLQLLLSTAQQVATRTQTQRDTLGRLVEDLSDVCGSVVDAGAEPVAAASLLSITQRPRATHTVGGHNANPGPGLTVTADTDALKALPVAWRQLADTARQRAQLAGIALTDHRTVTDAERTARDARSEAGRAAVAFDDHLGVLRRTESTASQAKTRLLDLALAWAPQHPVLRGLTTDSARDFDDARPAATTAGSEDASAAEDEALAEGTWEVADVEALREQEHGTVLDVLSGWAAQAQRLAERRAAEHEQTATSQRQQARTARTEADSLLAEAARRRAGQLLALPRPAWAGPGDDRAALGSALEWHSDLPAADRDRLELALADSGLLGAALDDSGISTATWQVTTGGPVVEPNLTVVLTSDPEHPQVGAVTALLQRIALAATAAPAEPPAADSSAASGAGTAPSWPAALVIGRDGTWRAGVLLADSAGAITTIGREVPVATHVGARQRRDAALREADRLEQQAHDLQRGADELELAAQDHGRQAKAVRAGAQSFPNDRELRSAEAARVSATDQHRALDTARELAENAATAADVKYILERDGWTHRTVSLDLPADLDQLRQLVDTGQSRTKQLTAAASTLEQRHLPRLLTALQQLDDEASISSRLNQLADIATTADHQASSTERELEQLRTNAGQDITHALAQHARLSEELTETTEELPAARRAQAQADQELTRTTTELAGAEAAVAQARPTLLTALHRLRQLLAVPAVAEVLLTTVALDSDDDALLEQLEAVLAGRRRTARHLVGQAYDNARSTLARTWTLARGAAHEGLPELDLYVLTHAEHEYTPAGAALKAAQLAARAQEQLAEAEHSALTDFVIGQLPSAIGTAWVDLRDWRHDVNRKMRAAAASSGVGVQVETPMRPGLDEATRTVYELCCKTSDADRTAQDKQAVGDAIRALLAAAPGENMLERLTNAVDITEWVDVHYLVTRPGKDATRWNRRTGLSGGERRLVVLAPMLAAIAANYDRLGPTGLRLAALDEVPAEVDERGREGLARYLAELDLDLLCTSYLWDGAPGAWDGIDAHDLEAGPDGTVVAYPMLVRGLLPLPGDPAPDL